MLGFFLDIRGWSGGVGGIGVDLVVVVCFIIMFLLCGSDGMIWVEDDLIILSLIVIFLRLRRMLLLYDFLFDVFLLCDDFEILFLLFCMVFLRIWVDDEVDFLFEKFIG